MKVFVKYMAKKARNALRLAGCFRLLPVLLLFSLQVKGQVKTWADLKDGDWLRLEYAVIYDSIGEYSWMSQVNRSVILKGTVRKDKNAMVLVFKPERLSHINRTAGYAYGFYDSYYQKLNPRDFQITPENSWLLRNARSVQSFSDAIQADSLVLVLSGNTVIDTSLVLRKNQWGYKVDNSGVGIFKTPRYFFSGKHMVAESAKTSFNAIMEYIRTWGENINKKQNHTIPYTIEIDLFPETSYFISGKGKPRSQVRLMDASFDLEPNTYLSCNVLNSQEPVLKIRDRQYKPNRKNNKVLQFAFYLSAPVKIHFDGAELLFSPGDSIFMQKDISGDFLFSGKGAADSRFEYERKKKSKLYPQGYHFNVGEVDVRLENIRAIYQSLWDEYASEMSAYWLHSTRLSLKYWEMCIYLSKYTDADVKSFRESESFSTVTPFIDHYYQPDGYEDFLKAFFSFRMGQLNEDNLSHLDMYSGNETEKYYVQKQLFTGYPRLFLMKNTLAEYMKRVHLSLAEREYHDFMEECNDPEMKQEIKYLHGRLEQLEPGKKIQDFKSRMEKYLPLVEDFTGKYILVSFQSKGYPWDSSRLPDMLSSVKQHNLKTQLKFLAIRPEKYKTTLPGYAKATDYYLFIDDSVFDSITDSLSCLENDYLLIRDDGTIVSRIVNHHVISSLIEIDQAQAHMTHIPASLNIRQIAFVSFLTAFMIAFIAVIWIRIVKMRERNKRMITELELKAIRSQMNPHFVFNALGSIQNLINQGKNTDANRYLVDFARLLRIVLAASDKELVLLSEEIAQLNLYLKLEQLRMPFEYRIHTHGICPDDEEIPGMLVQPLVENAVIHAIVPNRGGTIDIRFYKEDTVLFVEITDDGPGFVKETLNRTGFGIRSVVERLAILNRQMKTSIELNIVNRMEKEQIPGTQVIFSIPV